ncbi:MAG: hypothetical protein U1F81_17850 [Verrucomicrobiaceae bacterium]
MDYRLTFNVSLGGDPAATDEVVISNEALFGKLRHKYPDKSVNPRWFQLSVLYEEAKSTGLIHLLAEETKKRPVADSWYALNNLKGFFSVAVELEPSQHELDSQHLLYLAAPPTSLAEFEEVMEDDSYVVSKVRTKKKVCFGGTRTDGSILLFSDRLKELFIDSELKGVAFRPVKLPNESDSGLWQLYSDVRMPPLAMQLVDSWRKPYTGASGQVPILKNGTYYPVVLRYRQSDLKFLPNVDVLFSSERFGFKHNAHRYHIVSQRFRQVADKLAPGQFKYGLVAIGEGEELRRRYTIPELAPPEV